MIPVSVYNMSGPSTAHVPQVAQTDSAWQTVDQGGDRHCGGRWGRKQKAEQQIGKREQEEESRAVRLGKERGY